MVGFTVGKHGFSIMDLAFLSNRDFVDCFLKDRPANAGEVQAAGRAVERLVVA